MKSFIAATAVLILSFSLCLASSFYTAKCIDTVISETSSLVSNANGEQNISRDEILSKLTAADSFWSEKTAKLNLLLPHDDIEDITRLLKNAKAAALSDDRGEYCSLITSLSEHLEHLKKSESFSFELLF